jgi:DNA-binding HxlR family transcriptional regulator
LRLETKKNKEISAKRRGKYSRTGYTSPIDATLEVIGGKYKVAILYHLCKGAQRFGELRRLVPLATQRMLTNQLRELESDKLVHRQVFAEVPPKVEYSLTPLGKTLVQLKSNRTLPPRWACSIASLIWDGLYVVVIGKLNLPEATTFVASVSAARILGRYSS